MSKRPRRIAILGAGPTGLDAALAARELGFDFVIYEAAPAVAGHVRRWGHVRLFSPWDLDLSTRMRRGLARAGLRVPEEDECPTGDELVSRVLEPIARLPEIAPYLQTGVRVIAIGRDGLLKDEEIATEARAARPFRLLITDESGRERVDEADVVLDCTGSYGRRNTLGDGGIPALGERALNGSIVREIPNFEADPEGWAGATILLAGAGHSAQTAARDLAELARENAGTRVVWALRRPRPEWDSTPGDPLPERARLVARAEEIASGVASAVTTRRGMVTDALEPRNGRIRVTLRGEDGEREVFDVDRVLSLTGSVGDHQIYRQLQVHECYATAAPMKLSAALLADGSADCLDQTSHGAATLANPEPNFFILGSKSYGRNNTFLMRIGWQQVDEVMGVLDEGAPGA